MVGSVTKDQQALKYGFCRVDDCIEPAETLESGLCKGHRKRAVRGQTVSGPLKETKPPPWRLMVESAISLADAPDEDERAYRCAGKRLTNAAERHTCSRPAFQRRLAAIVLGLMRAHGVRARPEEVLAEVQRQLQVAPSVARRAKGARPVPTRAAG